MELLRHPQRPHDPYVLGQTLIRTMMPAGPGELALEVQMCHLTAGMDPGIGATGCMKTHR